MPEPKKANHRVDIVRLGEPRVHTNADTLELFDIGGYQVVTKKGNFKGGDLAIYIQPDSVVPQTEPFKFIWEPATTEFHGVVPEMVSVPERKRRITVRRFRKEWSEGLLMPLTDFFVVASDGTVPFHDISTNRDWTINEGDDVSDILNITHWEGEEVESTQSDNDNRPKRSRPRTLKGWFFFLLYRLGFKGAKRQMNEELSFDIPKFDVENIKNFKDTILPEDVVIVTEKIHGSQGRYFFKEGKMYAGSRNFWKAEKSPCVWRKTLTQNPWIEKWCRENEGAVLYGEVVPTQKGYRYGCDEGETKFFVFDIRDEQGEYLPKPATIIIGVLDRVPVLYYGPYAGMPTDISDGSSTVIGAKTAREGVVITVTDPTRWARGLGRIQLKKVSNVFLERDGK